MEVSQQTWQVPKWPVFVTDFHNDCINESDCYWKYLLQSWSPLIIEWIFHLFIIGGALYFEPEKACSIATSCFILHNICKKNGVQLNTPIVDQDEEEEDILQQPVEQEAGNAAARLRDEVAENWFH